MGNLARNEGATVRSIRSRAALGALVAIVSVGSAGVGSAARVPAARPAAVVDRQLRSAMSTSEAASRLETIVSAWDRSALKTLDRLGIKHRKLTVLPMAFARLTPAEIARLARIDGIRSIYGQRRYELYLNESARVIGARYAAERLKVNGAGSVIAVVDTGIDTNHPALPLGTKVLNNYEVVAPNVFEPGKPLLIENHPDTDDNEHGTHVAGTVAGSGAGAPAGKDYRGIAPGAKLIGYSANQGPTLLTTHTVAAFDHIIANARTTKVRAISNSWGGGDGSDFDPSSPVSISQEEAWRHGIVPVFAAGNSGNPGDATDDGLNTLSGQCVSPFVVCVAAMTKHRQVVTFSSKGRPAGNWDRAAAQRFHVGMYRPTITAPGVNIVAPAALPATADADKPYGYVSFSGTSMATPELSGVVALITGANPKLTPAQIVRILEATAKPMPGWDAHEEGAGAVDARAAVEAALAMRRGRPTMLTTPKLDYAAPQASRRRIATLDGIALPASYAHHEGVELKEFVVPSGVERLDIDLSWDTPAENLYGYLWAPSQRPDVAAPTSPPFAVQETWGLLCDTDLVVIGASGPCLLDGRKMAVRYPQPGRWKLAVYGRTASAAYRAVVDATVLRVPTTTASLDRGILSGAAAFPAPGRTVGAFEPLDGTDVVFRNPTLRPFNVYFHGEQPVGNVEVLQDGSPTWNRTKPAGDSPKSSHGNGAANHESRAFSSLLASFSGTATAALQGDLVVNFWGGAAAQGALGNWDVGVFAGDKLIATGATAMNATSELPTPIRVVVPGVQAPAGTPLHVQIKARYVDSGAHFAVYYDSAAMPSGMTLPAVTRYMPRAALEITDALVADARTGDDVQLSWPRDDKAKAYRIYSGSAPGAVRPVATVSQLALVRRSAGSLVVRGEIEFGHPGTSQMGLAESEYFANGCEGAPSFQGFDGWVFDLPANVRGKPMTLKGTGSGYDLDAHFYDADCFPLDYTDMATAEADEEGTVPEDAAHVVVVEFNGVPTRFTATISRGIAGDGRVRKMIGGLRSQTPAYFRISAIDRSGREGPLSDLLVARPTAFDRVVEVSVDGGPWTAVPVRVGRDGRGAWSVPVSSLRGPGIAAAAGGSSTYLVRARAGEAAGSSVAVRAAGAFRPAKAGPLPATGVDGGAPGALLAALAAGLAIRARRRRA